MTSEIITDKNSIPWYRRPLFWIMSWILFIPVGLLILWTGPAYVRVKGGGYQTMARGTKIFLSILGVIYLLFALAGALGDGSRDNQASSTETAAPSADTSSDSTNAASPPADTTSNSPSALSRLAHKLGPPPGMRVESEEGNGGNFLVKIIGDDDQPFTVQRVVVNGRSGEPGCDTTQQVTAQDSNVPATLKRGDSTFAAVACGAALLSADIYTDRGTASFKFN